MRFLPPPPSSLDLLVVAFVCLLPACTQASTFTTEAYASLPGIPRDQTSVDLYSCPTSAKALVLYVHGGAWIRGDKARVHSMPAYFAKNRVCFASANYPLTALYGQSVIEQQVAALSKLDNWLLRYGWRSSQGESFKNITIIGHSAGAHLVALADKRSGWNINVKNLILMDSGSYDIASRFNQSSERFRAHMSSLLQLGMYSTAEYHKVFKRYSPASLPPRPRSSGHPLNVFLLTSQRPNAMSSAYSLKNSYDSSPGYLVRLYKLPWKHEDFPRKVGVDLLFSQRLLKLVLANSSQ